MNGFGRFGLHLLKYWLDRSQASGFSLDYINDDFLSFEHALELIRNDRYVQILKIYKLSVHGTTMTFTSPDGVASTIEYTNEPRDNISWVGKVDYFLECSGKNTISKDCEPFLVGQTKKVVISATSWDCEKTLVYGFNHQEAPHAKIVSYGSCTVNAYVPLASFIHSAFGVRASDVNVIHNIQEYKLKDESNHTMVRKFCTLEKQGPNILKFINKDNFIVNYTIVPYAGVSMIDFRFELERPKSVEEMIQQLDQAFTSGALKHLYAFDETDRGPEVHTCTPYSSVFIRDKIKVLGNSLYMQAYFDNENSVNRYFDLVSYFAHEEAKTSADRGSRVSAISGGSKAGLV